MLHHVATGIVHDKVMADAVAVQLPACQLRALIAGAGFVDEDMDVDPLLDRVVDGRGGGAPIDGRGPAGVAMGQHVDTPAALLLCDLADDLQPVQPDLAVDLHILVANLGGAAIGGLGAGLGRKRLQDARHLIQRPFQVDRGRPGFVQHLPCFLQRDVRGIGGHLHRDAIGRRRPDQRRAAHPHVADRVGKILTVDQGNDAKLMRQPALVDDAHLSRRFAPDGAVGLAVDLHRMAS